MRFLTSLSVASLWLAASALSPGAVFAQETPDEPATQEKTAEQPQPEEPKSEQKPESIRLHLMEGSVVSGDLSVAAITVETEFGTLEVPVEKIVSFRPGLESHPQERRRIGMLVLQLGSQTPKERDEAQKALLDIGPPIREMLEEHRNDDDAERQTRIEKILADLEELASEDDLGFGDEPPLIDEDTVETTRFTVVGRISPESFTVKTKFGDLNVALRDIRLVERESDTRPEIRKSLDVDGTNLAQFNFKSSGVRVERGDVVNITADGKLVMTPWGNNQFSTPEGGANFQWYIPNQIPGGALIAKVGSSGKEFKVGVKHTFTVTRPGVLYFAIAMAPQFAQQGYNFPGEYNVKLRVNPQ